MQDFLKINDNDNVVVALNTIPAGEKITVSVGDGSKTVTAREEIPAGHKMAICDIPEGGEVIKYGYRIGNAKENIAEGSWIHTHNVKTALGDLLEYTYNPTPVEEKKTEDVTFMGFNRPDGKVGVRNEIRSSPPLAVSTTWQQPSQSRPMHSLKAVWKRLSHSLILTVVPRWATIRSIPVRFWQT